jgi:hypothetical protein
MLTTKRRICAPTDGGGRTVHQDAGELPGNDLAGLACGRCPVNPNVDPADPVPPVVPEAALHARLKRHEGARFSGSVAAWRDHWSALTEGSRDGAPITGFTVGVPRDRSDDRTRLDSHRSNALPHEPRARSAMAGDARSWLTFRARGRHAVRRRRP